MNIKQSIFQHLSALDGLTPEHIFQDTRKKSHARLKDLDNRPIQCIFFKGSGRVDNDIDTAVDRFEFHFLGKADDYGEDNLEQMREAFRTSISGFRGPLGGENGLVVYMAAYQNEDEYVDWETGEKVLSCEVVFRYMR